MQPGAAIMTIASKIEHFMLRLINNERADAGLDPLRLSSSLNAAAEKHTVWMLRNDVFDHTGAGGSNGGDRMQDAGYKLRGDYKWGENIALRSLGGIEGLRDDVRDLHNRLMDSPGHRANILGRGFDEIGIGIERGTFRLNGSDLNAVAVTQDFGRTDANISQSPPPDADTFVLRTASPLDAMVGQNGRLDLAATLAGSGDPAAWISALNDAGDQFAFAAPVEDRAVWLL